MISLDYKKKEMRAISTVEFPYSLSYSPSDEDLIWTTYFIADDLTLFDIEQEGHGKAAFVVGIDLEVYIAQVGDILVDRIRGYVVAWQLLVRRCEPPPLE